MQLDDYAHFPKQVDDIPLVGVRSSCIFYLTTGSDQMNKFAAPNFVLHSDRILKVNN